MTPPSPRGAAAARAPRAGDARDYPILILLAATFLVCYAPTLLTDYGYGDDYRDLDAGPLSYLIRHKAQEGRLLYAAWTSLLMLAATEIRDLLYFRIVGLLGIALLAWSLFQALVRAGCSRLHSYCVGVIICSALPFQVWAVGASTALFPYAAFASGTAFRLGERAFVSHRPRSTPLLAAGAVLVLTSALAVYQPAAMLFWVFTAIALLGPQTSGRDAFRRFRWHCLIAAGAMLLNYVQVRLANAVWPELPRNVDLLGDLPGAAAWFLSEVLPNALNFAWFPVGGIVSWLVFAAIAGGLLSYLHGRPGRRVKIGVALALLPLSHAPNLAVAQNVAAYRTLVGVTSLIVVLAWLAFQGYVRRLHLSSASFGVNAAVGAAAAACLLSAAWRVDTFFVTPQRLELAVMRSQLTPDRLAGAQSIVIVRSRPEDNFTPLSLHDELGLLTSTVPDAPAMARLLLLETAPAYAELPVTSVRAGALAEAPLGALVVDMSNLRETAARIAPESPVLP